MPDDHQNNDIVLNHSQQPVGEPKPAKRLPEQDVNAGDAASQVATDAQTRSMGSFQENMYNRLDDLTQELTGLKSKVSKLEETTAKTVDIVGVAHSIQLLTDSLQGVSDRFDSVERDAEHNHRIVLEKVTKSSNSIHLLEQQFAGQIRNVEGKIRNTAEQYYGKAKNHMSEIRNDIVQDSFEHRKGSEKDLELLKRELEQEFQGFTDETRSSIERIEKSTQQERVDIDRKVNEVIAYLKSQKPISVAENSVFEMRLKTHVGEMMAASEKRQEAKFESFRGELVTGRRWAITTAIAAIASLAGVLGILLTGTT